MVSYKPLWRYLLEHDISKQECRVKSGISPNTWTKLNKNEEVSMTVINKICNAYNIDYYDVMEFVPEGSKTKT